jgi:hypothetical protein
MTSILKVDKLQDSSGTGTPYITGAVLQTVVHQETNMATFSMNGANDILFLASNASDSTTHLSLSITPKSVNSKILLSTTIFHEINGLVNYNTLWGFYRDSTKLGASVVGSRRGGIATTVTNFDLPDNATTPDMTSYQYYDSPNTTSAITYAVSVNHSNSGGTMYINRTVNDTDNGSTERGISILIAQEIGG